MTAILRTYKYRLYPNKKQQRYFTKCFGGTRFIYNQMLHNKKEIYEKYKDDPETLKNIKPRIYTSYKHEHEWLKEVDNYALANAQIDLMTAYNRFYRGISKFPKFKSKKNRRNSYKTNNQGDNIRIENNKVNLPKIKFVRLKYHRPIKGKIRSCVISMVSSGKYYISILTEEIPDKHNKTDAIVGVDLGIKDFVVMTNNLGSSIKIKSPRFLIESEKELVKQSRALSRKKTGGSNFHKARIKLSKIHEKIANQRKDFLHKLSCKITNENQVIVIESLKLSDIQKNRMLSKAVSDASWYEFARQLEYKSKWKERRLVKADQWYPSSQTCSNCGNIEGKKPLNIRHWKCSDCGAIHDRDINASINLLKIGMAV